MIDRDAQRLAVSKGEKALQRKGFLTLWNHPGPKRLLYVTSLFPLSQLTPHLYQELQLGQKPLGQITQEQQLPFKRDAVGIARVTSPDLASHFGLPENEPIWAREYRLTLSGNISGIIFEAISPLLYNATESNAAS